MSVKLRSQIQKIVIVHNDSDIDIVNNTGSVARDNLANERTFLSWLRTGITLMGVGTALVKFNAVIPGIIFNIMGLIFIICANYRYYEVLDALKKDKFVINAKGIMIITLATWMQIQNKHCQILYNQDNMINLKKSYQFDS